MVGYIVFVLKLMIQDPMIHMLVQKVEACIMTKDISPRLGETSPSI
jgi:hypothetical protein